MKLYSTTVRESRVSFHWLHEKCGTRVKQQYYCPKDEEVLTRDEMVRGYEVSKGRYVPVEEEELAATKAESRDDIGVIEFVPVETINPLFYEHAYYLAPDRHGDRAYAILAKALAKEERVAIGRYAARGDDHVVAIQEHDGALVMLQLKFADEVRSADEIPVPSIKVDNRELGLAEQLIQQNSAAAFDPKHYKDDVRLRKLKLIEGKLEAGMVEEAEADETGAPAGETIDLMAALKASLGATPGTAKRRSTNGHRRAAHRTRRARPAARAKTQHRARSRSKSA